MQFSRTTAGYSLVETLVAISVLMLALVGPISIAAKSLQSAFFAREQVTALYLAQEGIEAITTLRNNHYIELVDNDGTNDLGVAGVDTAAWISGNFIPQGTAPLGHCIRQHGCNFTVNNGQISNVERCDPPNNPNDCFMKRSTASVGPAYVTAGSGDDTKYRRVIKVTPDTSAGLVEVEVTVSWSSSLFPSGSNEVVVKSIVVDYLQNFN
jgi:hypothetical protein